MPGSRLFWKIFASLSLPVVAATVIALLVVVPATHAVLLDEATTRLQAVSRVLAPEVRSLFDDAPGATDVVRSRLRAKFSEVPELRLSVQDASGRDMSHPGFSPDSAGATGSPPLLQQAANAGEASAVRSDQDGGQEHLVFVLVIRDEGPLRRSLFITAAMPLAGLHDRVAPVHSGIWIGAAFALLAGFGLSAWLSRRLLAPLDSLAREAASLEDSGAIAVNLRDSPDEVGDLARAFSAQRARLHGRMREAQRERERATAILAAMRDGVIAVDGRDTISFINTAAEVLLVLPAGSARGRLLHEAIRIPGVLDCVARGAAGEATPPVDVRTQSGPMERIIEVQATRLPGQKPEHGGAVLVLRDVTELRSLETMRRDFVANVSHELKTPLTAIKSMVETLVDDPQTPFDVRQRFLEKVATQTSRLTSLVTDLLSLSRLDSTDTGPAGDELDLSQQAIEATRLLSQSASAKSIALSIQVPPAPVVVRAEEENLRQMISNLLDNAIKYTPQGGKVSLTVRTDGDKALLEVSDTGIGIESSQIDRIFERFYRVDKARSRAVGGTGLGLSIVKHVVHSLGGSIDVRSVPGHGSTFIVRLPLFVESRRIESVPSL